MAFDIQQLSLNDNNNSKKDDKKKKFGKKVSEKTKSDTLDKKKSTEQIEKTIQSLEEEKIYRKGIISVKDLISPASFRITPHEVEINGKVARTIFVVGYPRYITIGWFAPIINMNSTMDIAMFFYPVDVTLVLKQLRNRVGGIEAQLSADAEKGAPRNPMAQAALEDMENLRDDLTQGIEHFFQFALYVTIYANTTKELDQFSDDVDFLFGSKLVTTKRAFYQAEQGFNSTLPFGNDELNIVFNMNSSPIASSFPFISSELTSNSGILYGINQHNNSLIIFDRFSLTNANSVVFATSGAGKSYTVKLEVLRSLMIGVDVIIIDPEFEYKTLSDAVGGTYINISLNSETKINPFDLPKSAGISGSKVSDIIRSSVITLKGLLKIMLGELTHQEDALIDRALLETYAKKDIDASSDLATIEAPLMQDLYDVLDGMDGTSDIALRLKKYTEGTFSGLFNSPTNIEMKNQLVVFCVRDLEDELRPIGIYNIVNYVWNIIRSQLKKRILIIDEAWWLMQNQDSAKFVYALVKRCRKYYLGVTTITQDVNDFLNNEYGRAIVTNVAMQILLKQSPAAIDNLAKIFMLTEGEKYLLLERGLGEGIFFAGQKHAAIKIIASYSEDQIVTTDPKQILKLQEAKKQFDEEMSKQNQMPKKEDSLSDIAGDAKKIKEGDEEGVESGELKVEGEEPADSDEDKKDEATTSDDEFGGEITLEDENK